jgi:hypothetical protein
VTGAGWASGVRSKGSFVMGRLLATVWAAALGPGGAQRRGVSTAGHPNRSIGRAAARYVGVTVGAPRSPPGPCLQGRCDPAGTAEHVGRHSRCSIVRP